MRAATPKPINTVLGPKYVFTCTIPANQAAITALFRDDSLSTYDVVVFDDNPRVGGSGAIYDTSAKNAFQRWLKHGGGLVGIRAVMDHNNTWPWLRDSVFNGTIFTQHSNWGSDPNAKVQWDTLQTNGVLNSIKTEYDSLRACFPPLHTRFTYPDEWYSFSVNPRPFADILLTIDESTYTVPSGSAMGLGHPVAWAYHLPPDQAGNVGRFIYSSRGHETGAWDGTSSNHAPIDSAHGAIVANGIVYSDTSKTVMTKGFLWQSIRWAAGLMTPTSIQVVSSPNFDILKTHQQNGVLSFRVTTHGKHEVTVYNLSGRNVGFRIGSGDAQYSFANLTGSSLYIVRVKSEGRIYSQLVLP